MNPLCIFTDQIEKLGSQIKKYLQFKTKAVSKHKVHSPFVFDFICNVLENKENYYAYLQIEQVRSHLQKDKKSIHVEDLGAGSKKSKLANRQISEIARHSIVNEKYGKMLFRLVDYFQPQTIIELGTSLGLSGAYLSKANSKAKIFTIEGSKEVAAVAKQTFSMLKLENVYPLVGNFDEVLPELVNKLGNIDLVYFDGNHQKEPTLNYFHQCLRKAGEHTIFIFDDIHWSDDMEEAWNEIRKDKRVSLSIDLFRMGIVFFKKEMPKQHFTLKF